MLTNLSLLFNTGAATYNTDTATAETPDVATQVTRESSPTLSQHPVNHQLPVQHARLGAAALGLGALLRRGQTEDRRKILADHFDGLARAKLNHPDLEIHGPWAPSLTEEQRAQDHLFILEKTYGVGGHPALGKPEATVALQKSGKLLTWILYFQKKPIATASLTIKDNGTAELCRAAAIPVGTSFPDGTVYSQRFNGSAVQYTRLAEFFRHAVSEGLWALETDLRISAPYVDPDGTTINGGAATQHINAFMTPFLIFLPKIVLKGGKYFIEGLCESRLFLQPENMDLSAPIYTPAVNTKDPSAPSAAEILQATYGDAFGMTPNIISDDGSVVSKTNPEATIIDGAPERFAIYEISGSWTDEELDALLAQARQEYLVVEMAVKNEIGNIALQRQLYQRGFIPSGVKPGGHFDVKGKKITVPIRLHFLMSRPDLNPHVRPIELASDYKGTRIGDITHRLFQYWQELHPN